jgi:hypothetical protein
LAKQSTGSYCTFSGAWRRFIASKNLGEHGIFGLFNLPQLHGGHGRLGFGDEIAVFDAARLEILLLEVGVRGFFSTD